MLEPEKPCSRLVCWLQGQDHSSLLGFSLQCSWVLLLPAWLFMMASVFSQYSKWGQLRLQMYHSNLLPSCLVLVWYTCSLLGEWVALGHSCHRALCCWGTWEAQAEVFLCISWSVSPAFPPLTLELHIGLVATWDVEGYQIVYTYATLKLVSCCCCSLRYADQPSCCLFCSCINCQVVCWWVIFHLHSPWLREYFLLTGFIVRGGWTQALLHARSCYHR